ncbi:MAG: ankyrin repeat domain-containing protein [Armatimonadota bacterium]
MSSISAKKENIHLAARLGEIKQVEELLNSGIDVDIKDRNSYTPLRHAAESQKKEVVKLLLTKGAKPDLHIAACLGDDKMLIDLINQGMDVNSTDSLGETPLHMAAQNDHVDTVNLLISKGANTNAKNNQWQTRTPLHYAAEFRNNKVVELLLKAGADVNVKDNYGNTPLAAAVEWSGDYDVNTEKLLLDGEADVNAVDNRKYSSLHIAVYHGVLNLAKYLISRGGKTDLYIACGLGDEVQVSSFISSGADINAKDMLGRTPLHWAAENSQAAIVRLLLANGANVNAIDEDGRSPLHQAIKGPNHFNRPATRSKVLGYIDNKNRYRVVELLISG